MAAIDLATALRAGGRGIRSQPSANRAKRTIVVAEVALAVTLLTGAGLLLHSFVKLLSVDPGFKPEGVLSMKRRGPPAHVRQHGDPRISFARSKSASKRCPA